MAILVDCHTHTSFSDGASTLEENIRAAKEAGVRIMALTDHLTLPSWLDPDCECSVPEARLPELELAYAKACVDHPDIELVYGFEADWYEGCEPNIAKWRGGSTFMLGSVHFIDGRSVDYPKEPELWDELGADGVWPRYVDCWTRACFCQAGFDSMAHPDLPAYMESTGYARSISLEPLWRTMAEAAHEAHVHVEVSSAGLRKSLGAIYPAEGLLREFRHAEVPITLGSDAHRFEDIAHAIPQLQAYAYEAGYRSFDAPRANGDWVTIQL